jgi:hypothetical protein
MKVVDLPKIYIFSFYRFSSCIQKVEVILNLQKLYFCPLLNLKPNFKNYSKSEFGSKTKVVEIKILNNFYFGNFLSFNTNLKIILQFPKKSVLGELQYPDGFLLCLPPRHRRVAFGRAFAVFPRRMPAWLARAATGLSRSITERLGWTEPTS